MAEIGMMMPKEQGIKIKQPVEGLPRYPFVTLRASAHRNDKREGLAMAPFCHPERSEGIVVVAGFIPATVGDKTRPCGVHRAIKPRSERSEGIIVVAGFIPATVGDKPRPYGVHQAIKPRSERSEGIIVVAGFIPASVGDKPRPCGVHQTIKERNG